jgi:hypothetical protein
VGLLIRRPIIIGGHDSDNTSFTVRCQ